MTRDRTGGFPNARGENRWKKEQSLGLDEELKQQSYKWRGDQTDQPADASRDQQRPTQPDEKIPDATNRKDGDRQQQQDCEEW